MALEQCADVIMKAILSDLADEQSAYRIHKWSGALPSNKIKTKLRRLNILCSVEPPHELSTFPAGIAFIKELLLQFEVLLQKLPSFLDKIWFRYEIVLLHTYITYVIRASG